ncbi:MAG: 30S ribosomal protein S9 [Bacteroidales bacterium]|nr:30S ribosomal protein S9 [Bacteroidales bacterium]
MEVINTVGRRKTAVARVYMTEGKGNIIINERTFESYFPTIQLQNTVKQPLTLVGLTDKFDVKVNLTGGGFKGQAEALRLAIARALVKYNEEYKSILRKNGLLTRDPREVERKKPGRPKARKRFQFSKR